MPPIVIKICGIRDEEIVHLLGQQKIDYVGFVIFPASPRHVELERLRQLVAVTRHYPDTKTVAVLVNPDESLLDQLQDIGIDYVQLHGGESDDYIETIKQRYHFGIIKAITVKDKETMQQWEENPAVDYYLFDAKPPENSVLPGGNGVSFDWKIAADRSISRPWMLSGGLNSDNIAQALTESGAKAIDVSSAVESAPGQKDPEKIINFITKVRGLKT